VALMNLLPLISIVFIFDNKKHFIWDTVEEAKETIREHIEVVRAYVDYWGTTEPERTPRLNRITKNLNVLESLLKLLVTHIYSFMDLGDQDAQCIGALNA
jgi:hypothetical protein